ncbi:MAG: MFS transporter [Actinomycetales bacterium]|nr:MFS transporter [Actinomycetales bacterium]
MSDAKKANSWISRNLIVLSIVSFTQDAASELMYPLMPLFLTGVLAAPAIVLGIVEGAAEVTAGVSKYFAGKASDRIGSKTLITTGYAFAGLGKLFVASAVIWPMVMFGRVVDRIGKGIRSAPRDALITKSVEPNHYARAFGFHRSADTFGAVLGPVLALVGLALLNNDVRAVMWWAVIPAVLSVVISFFVQDIRVAKSVSDQVANSEQPEKLPRAFWQAAIPFIIFALTNLPDTMLLLRLSQLGTSMTNVVLAYIGFNLVYTLAAYPAGIIADRLSAYTVYAIGLLAFAITYITLGRLTEPSPVMYVAVAVYGFFPALTDGIGKAIVSHTVPKSIHGRAQGVFQSLSGGSILIAGTWAGLLWSKGNGHGALPMTLAGIVAGIGALVLLLSRSTRPLEAH